MNYFELLELPTSYDVDPDALERSFLSLSRRYHPDFHQLASSEELAKNQATQASLNDAYTTLKQPFRRAEYLLSLLGGPSASEQKEMPPEFLEDVLELRLEIEEAKESEDALAIAAMEERLARDRDEVMGRVGRTFTRLDAAEAANVETRRTIRSDLNIVRYLNGLIRDLRE
ncbi:hypothetical protein Pan216_23610 [Planctomycetes bacterium Pan216]|uniref:J domain-containing protein n=1 Tax=Kolteria novifilia TaxID=2527975 RepID=A0A518B3D0_9BACT|nr:hypothetical protein Pan216_23610 [Planctomycetes bacterium Pan216]